MAQTTDDGYVEDLPLETPEGWERKDDSSMTFAAKKRSADGAIQANLTVIVYTGYKEAYIFVDEVPVGATSLDDEKRVIDLVVHRDDVQTVLDQTASAWAAYGNPRGNALSD